MQVLFRQLRLSGRIRRAEIYGVLNQEAGLHVFKSMKLKALCLVVFCLAACLPAILAQSLLSPGEHQAVENGVKLWYKVAGQAAPGQAPVLFLHGGPGYNSYSFERTVGNQLETQIQMIYLDERGSGRSERPAGADYSMSTLVADVEALRKSLGIPQLTLMGHSFGGTIALEYAARHPEHVQKLIILDGAADMPATFRLWQSEIEDRYPTLWQTALKGSDGGKLRLDHFEHDGCAVAEAEFGLEMSVLKSVDGQAFHNWQQFHDQRYQKEQTALDKESGLRNTGEIGTAYFGPDSQFPCYRFTAFSRLTMPTLVIVGKYDRAIGVQQMQALAARLPNAHFDEFDQSSHFVYAEQPVKFVRDIEVFLTSGK